MRSAWRSRCPEGHSAISTRGDGYRCKSCGVVYEGESFDAAEEEFPIDEARYETREFADAERVLREMAAKWPDRKHTRVSYLSHLGRPKDIGAKLRQLRKRGLVEKIDMGDDSALWQPTEQGLDVAQSDGLDRDSEGQMLAGCQP